MLQMWKLLVFLTLLSLAYGRQLRYQNAYSPNMPKDPRILFVFPIDITSITNPFNNLFGKGQSCLSKAGESGTCLNAASCILQKGKFIGLCGLLTKVCCQIETIIDGPTGSITSDSTPTGTNTYLVRQSSTDICQARLDFNSFSIEQPTSGACSTGTFKASNHFGADITICGENVDQHMYLTFNTGEDIKVQIITASSTSAWNITVTQISCADAVPTGCLQHFSENSRTLQSFNYKPYDGDNIYQIANLNYRICIDDGGNSKASFSAPNDMSFVITGSQGESVTDITTCTTDYLTIPGAIIPVAGTDRNTMCGGSFINVETTSKPFQIEVVSDGSEPATDVFNNGFQIAYILAA